MATVLIVDDDSKIIEMLRRTLAYEGYRVVTALNGLEALAQARDHNPDLIVLDWMLPKLDGPAVLQKLRNADRTPVLMLTARNAIEDRVDALELGADDYLVKPFAPEELLARVQALLRRAAASSDRTPLRFADLMLEPSTREVRRGTRQIQLTPREFDLLLFFLRRPCQVLKRDTILQEVWGYASESDDTVIEVYVGYLRSKLEAAGEARLIHTVRAVGYILRDP
ncbi:MAG: response regulator transcription factor [Chloroflexi bacterium]|nr:response regulator transcription factor [Chloroflexota bacterium]